MSERFNGRRNDIEALTAREIAALRRTASGMPTSDIANELALSTLEVAAVMISIRAKLGVASTAEAVRTVFG